MPKVATFTPIHWHGVLSALAASFRAIGWFLMAMAEAGPRMDQVRRLNAMSDDDLAAKGLTRQGEVYRIFCDRMYL